jgi:L-ascorbate metabolism protein UlaG (beta-lactamase superfamily)
MNGEG